MKRILLILLLILCSQLSKAQEEPSSLASANFKTLSLSAQWNLLKTRPYPLAFANTSSTKFRGLGISLANHEIEKRKYKSLNALVFIDNTKGIIEDESLNAFSISVGIGRYIHLFGEERFRLKYGGGLVLNYFFRNRKAKQANVFDRTIHAANLGLVFESHLEIQVIEKLHFFLGIDLKGSTFGFDYSYVDDPRLNEAQRKNGGFDFSIGEDSIVKVGIGFRI